MKIIRRSWEEFEVDGGGGGFFVCGSRLSTVSRSRKRLGWELGQLRGQPENLVNGRMRAKALEFYGRRRSALGANPLQAVSGLRPHTRPPEGPVAVW